MKSIVTRGAWFVGSRIVVALLIERGVVELLENTGHCHHVPVLPPGNVASATWDWSCYLGNTGAS